MAIDVLTRAKEWGGRNWKQLSVIGMTMIALSGCMEEQLPNDATPDQTNKDSTTNSTVIPTSQRLVDEELENAQKGEPSQIELDLWAAGGYGLNDW